MWCAICKAAARVGSDPMPRLQHISVMYRLAARRCLGIFPQLFPRKTGSLVVETPRLPGRSAVSYGLTAVLARNQADGVSASPPKPNKAARASRPAATRAALILAASSLLASPASPIREPGRPLVSHQLLGVVGDYAHECKAGPCRGGRARSGARLCCPIIG